MLLALVIIVGWTICGYVSIVLAFVTIDNMTEFDEVPIIAY